MARFSWFIAALGWLLLGSPATAQDYGDPSGKPLIASGDVRLVGVDGERSWLDGGFGKSRFGNDDGSDSFRIKPHAVEGDLVWSPQIGWSFGATIAATAQEGQENPVDLSEAYASWRRSPHGGFRLSARAGLFWPPISLEHGGADWSVTDTITPSAINSWVGEEVKVTGAEVSASQAITTHDRVYATGAIFGFNDTAGTLLAFRGWALHDEKAVAFGHQPLPPLDGFIAYVQAPTTRPVIELDNRPGFYGRLGWNHGDLLKAHVLYYDNRGDPTAVNAALQWGWRTRFIEAGVKLRLGTSTHVVAQAMSGSTQMGYPMDGKIWVDTHFNSAFALLSRDIGRLTVSGRVEAFGTKGRGSVVDGEYGEHGWTSTFAIKRPITDHFTVLLEALHIDSDRGNRPDAGVAPTQRQNIVQFALRLHS